MQVRVIQRDALFNSCITFKQQSKSLNTSSNRRDTKPSFFAKSAENFKAFREEFNKTYSLCAV